MSFLSGSSSQCKTPRRRAVCSQLCLHADAKVCHAPDTQLRTILFHLTTMRLRGRSSEDRVSTQHEASAPGVLSRHWAGCAVGVTEPVDLGAHRLSWAAPRQPGHGEVVVCQALQRIVCVDREAAPSPCCFPCWRTAKVWSGPER